MWNEHLFDTLEPRTGEAAGHNAHNIGAIDHNSRCVEEALGALTRMRMSGLSNSEAAETIRLIGKVRARADSMTCTTAANAKTVDPNLDTAEVIRQQTGVSGRDAKQLVRVAERLNDLPEVADRLADGDITLDHARLLADAADKIGGGAVVGDQGLLSLAEHTPADSFGRRVRGEVNRRLIETGDDPLQRQRKQREAKLWTEKETGLGVILAKLPSDEFIRVRQNADRLYLRELRNDGKDGRNADEVRTPAQRMADVVSMLLGGRDDPDAFHQQHGGPKPSTQVIVVAPIGVVDGADPDAACEIIGAGPVPRSYLETLSPDTLVAGMLYDRKGRVLWLGRNQRLGAAAQRLAVAVRDGGCFECGAPMHRSELHHIRPWRDGGRTDIENLVAVCSDHHKWLEAENLAVRRVNGRWQAVPRDGPPTGPGPGQHRQVLAA